MQSKYELAKNMRSKIMSIQEMNKKMNRSAKYYIRAQMKKYSNYTGPASVSRLADEVVGRVTKNTPFIYEENDSYRSSNIRAEVEMFHFEELGLFKKEKDGWIEI